jgi:hypothetical protein
MSADIGGQKVSGIRAHEVTEMEPDSAVERIMSSISERAMRGETPLAVMALWPDGKHEVVGEGPVVAALLAQLAKV